jgi:large subunit ribosomal protein L15
MQLNQLTPNHKPRKSRRVGRGGKRGTYSGRGMKGQKSRAGRKMQPAVRELIKKYPKLRGYRFNPKYSSRVIVKLEDLEKNFEPGEKVSPQILVEKKIIRKSKGRVPEVKILASGKIEKKLDIENCLFSKTAKEAVEKAGGTIK